MRAGQITTVAPTASAVVADVIDALKEGVKIHDSLFWKPAEKPEGQLEDKNSYPWYIRVTGVAAALLPQARAGCVFNQESAAIHAAIAGQGAVLARSSLVVQSLRDRSLVLLSPHTLPLPEAYWLVSAPEGSATHPWCDDFKHWVLDEAERDLAYWRDALSTATTPTGAKADAA